MIYTHRDTTNTHIYIYTCLSTRGHILHCLNSVSINSCHVYMYTFF